MVSDTDADTDGDGISNVDEVDTYGTDQRVADTPSDSIVSGGNNNGGGCFIQMLFE